MTKEQLSPHLTGFQRHLPPGVNIVSALYTCISKTKDGRILLRLDEASPDLVANLLDRWCEVLAPLCVTFRANERTIEITPYPSGLWKVLDGTHWIEIGKNVQSIRISPIMTLSDEEEEIIPSFL